MDEENEITVCDNGRGDASVKDGTAALCIRYNATYNWTAPKCNSCYESANMVAPSAEGDWLCFPSDDSLYVADFGKIMIETAVRMQADLVYCDCVYKSGQMGNPAWPEYSVLDVQPRIGRIDKTCFILRRELFRGFPPHRKDFRDGALIEQVIRDGAKHAKAPGILVVHQ